MALMKCAKCGEEYSNNVESCPHCNFTPDVFVCTECNSLCRKTDTKCAKCGNPMAAETMMPITAGQVEVLKEKTIREFNEAETLKEWRFVNNVFLLIKSYTDVEQYLERCNEKISELSAIEKRKEEYKTLCSDIENANKQESLFDLLKKLETFSEYEGVEEIRTNGFAKWQVLAYEEASGIKKHSEAIKLYEQLGDYQESKEKCEERKRLAAEQKRKVKKTAIIVSIVLAVIIAIVIAVNFYFIPKKHYEEGKAAYKAKEYTTAIEAFTQAKGFKNSDELILKSSYKAGSVSLEEKDYNTAASFFKEAGKYKDAKSLKEYCNGMVSMDAGNYESAYEHFKNANGVKDSDRMITACDLLEAEEYYEDGLLIDAKKLYSELPKDFEYNGISVSKRLATLDKYSSYISLLNTWKDTSGNMEVRQTHDSTGIWHNWTASGAGGELKIKSCKILDNGKVRIEGSASFWVYTEYSSIGSVVDNSQDYKTVSFTKDVSSMPSGLTIGSYTKLTISGKTAKVDYYKYSPNEDAYFTYFYETNMVFKQ